MNKRITIFVASSLLLAASHSSEPLPLKVKPSFGEELGKEVASCLEISRSKSHGANLPGGANSGSVATTTLVIGAHKLGSAATGAIVSGGCAAKEAFTIVAPYAGIVMAISGAAYGGYQVYRSKNPTPEQEAKAAEDRERSARAQAEDKAHAARARAEEQQHIEEESLIKCRRGLRDCLIGNKAAPLNNWGIPLPCAAAAEDLSIRGGEEEVERISSPFRRFVAAQRKAS